MKLSKTGDWLFLAHPALLLVQSQNFPFLESSITELLLSPTFYFSSSGSSQAFFFLAISRQKMPGTEILAPLDKSDLKVPMNRNNC